MTTNNPPVDGAVPVPPAPSPEPATKPAAHEFSKAERFLVIASLAIALLCDRLLFAPLFWWDFHLPYCSGIFWLIFLGIFYALFWNRLKANKISWMIAGFTALLCVWSLLFDYRSSYGIVTMFVIPGVVMAHVVFSMGGHRLKEVGAIVLAWISGWIVKPFSAIPMLAGAVSSMTASTNGKTIKTVIAGVCCTVPVLLIVVPLLGSADLVFGHYLRQMLDGFDIVWLANHTIAILLTAILFYSYLWNAGFAEPKKVAATKEICIDSIISCMVLGAVCALYALFCAVQFTYLFAGAGLPASMTYSEYAREGFAQIIVICAINLCLFGIFLQYGKANRASSILLILLLCLSGVMLASGLIRLNLYIATYGLTWLRLLSAWFILYLAVVIVLCFVRLVKERLPLIAICAFVLLGWYTVLGYANPDAMIMNYHLRTSENPAAWVAENCSYVRSLSDDAMLALLCENPDAETMLPILGIGLREGRGYSLSSHRLEQLLRQMP